MASVKELYDLIKKRQRNGEKIGILQQSIIDAYESDEPQKGKQVEINFQKNENQNTRQPTQNQIQQKK